MKIRNGFVSNSSSSSFIISSFESPKMTITIDLSAMSEKIENKNQLDDYYLEEYEYETIEEFLKEESGGLAEEYERVLSELNEGCTIYAGYVSNDSGDTLENLIYDNGFSGILNFDVIRNGR
jgi:hypothetical protein